MLTQVIFQAEKVDVKVLKKKLSEVMRFSDQLASGKVSSHKIMMENFCISLQIMLLKSGFHTPVMKSKA